MTEPVLPNEEAAEFVTDIKGWVCKTCRRFHGDDGGSERTARYCCEKDHACGTKGCGHRAEKPYVYCKGCIRRRERDRWIALPEVPWDGETPLVLHDDDTFFYAPEDLDDYLADHEGLKIEDLELVICIKDRKPYLDLREFVSEYLPENMEADDPTHLEAVVNQWIQDHVPDVWVPGKTRPTLASLKEVSSVSAEPLKACEKCGKKDASVSRAVFDRTKGYLCNVCDPSPGSMEDP